MNEKQRMLQRIIEGNPRSIPKIQEQIFSIVDDYVSSLEIESDEVADVLTQYILDSGLELGDALRELDD